MGARVLVTYATRGGFTASVSVALGHLLTAQGLQVDVLPVGVMKDIEIYSAVIAGSGVRDGAWLPEAVEFLHEHCYAMEYRPTTLYSTCLTEKDITPTCRREIEGTITPLFDIVKPFSIGYFAGRKGVSKHTLLQRARFKLNHSPPGDQRDDLTVDDWVREIQSLIMPVGAI